MDGHFPPEWRESWGVHILRAREKPTNPNPNWNLVRKWQSSFRFTSLCPKLHPRHVRDDIAKRQMGWRRPKNHRNVRNENSDLMLRNYIGKRQRNTEVEWISEQQGCAVGCSRMWRDVWDRAIHRGKHPGDDQGRIQWSSHRQIAPETSIPLGKLLRNFSNQTATSPFPPEHLQTPHSQSTNTEWTARHSLHLCDPQTPAHQEGTEFHQEPCARSSEQTWPHLHGWKRLGVFSSPRETPRLQPGWELEQSPALSQLKCQNVTAGHALIPCFTGTPEICSWTINHSIPAKSHQWLQGKGRKRSE